MICWIFAKRVRVRSRRHENVPVQRTHRGCASYCKTLSRLGIALWRHAASWRIVYRIHRECQLDSACIVDQIQGTDARPDTRQLRKLCKCRRACPKARRGVFEASSLRAINEHFRMSCTLAIWRRSRFSRGSLNGVWPHACNTFSPPPRCQSDRGYEP